ncbi:MAG TPA: hypothetical protein VFT75_18510 [Nocardioidaceae bacterium]|nr:hypothetical protein [Nocardioidaceae bacterium]
MTAAQDRSVLTDWWLESARQEIERTVPKAVEYGSGDLAEIGYAMSRIMGRDLDRSPAGHQQATELGIFFYLVGKTARWEQAIHDGRQASDDTLFDMGVYVKMAQRNRAVGGWPFGPEPEREQDKDGGW